MHHGPVLPRHLDGSIRTAIIHDDHVVHIFSDAINHKRQGCLFIERGNQHDCIRYHSSMPSYIRTLPTFSSLRSPLWTAIVPYGIPTRPWHSTRMCLAPWPPCS